MIKVVHVVSQLDTGGMEKLLVEFARFSCRDTYSHHVVSLTNQGPLAEELGKYGCPITALGSGQGLRPGLILRLARVFHSLRAEIVHTHNTRPLLYGAPAARLARVRTVVHTRHGQRYGARDRETRLFCLASRLVDRVVSVSHDGSKLSRAEGVNPDRVTTIWNGIDTERFAYMGPCPHGPAVMVGRLSPEKDVSTLLEAAAQAVAASPQFRLEIAGNGACLADLKRQAEALKLGDSVRFLGEVRDIAKLLQRASLFVLPSLTEGISLTLLEAMGRGLPVVATRVGGTPEVVVDGETGFLVPPRSPTAMAFAMLLLQRDPEKAEFMGRSGRRRLEEYFDARRMIKEYENLYSMLSKGHFLRRTSGIPTECRICS